MLGTSDFNSWEVGGGVDDEPSINGAALGSYKSTISCYDTKSRPRLTSYRRDLCLELSLPIRANRAQCTESLRFSEPADHITDGCDCILKCCWHIALL